MVTKTMLSFALDTELRDRIDRAAKLRGVGRSEWLRRVVTDHLDGTRIVVHRSQTDPPTPTEAADIMSLVGQAPALQTARSGVPPLGPPPPALGLSMPPPEGQASAKAATIDALRAAMSGVGQAPDPEVIEPAAPSAFALPHFGIRADGSCAGGCDPNTDVTCSISPDDPRRTGRRKKP